jgi:hypothetical protein
MNWLILISAATAVGSTLDVDPLACQRIQVAVQRVLAAETGVPGTMKIKCGPYPGPQPPLIPQSQLPIPPGMLTGPPTQGAD